MVSNVLTDRREFDAKSVVQPGGDSCSPDEAWTKRARASTPVSDGLVLFWAPVPHFAFAPCRLQEAFAGRDRPQGGIQPILWDGKA
jgi:hypothetical protein